MLEMQERCVDLGRAAAVLFEEMRDWKALEGVRGKLPFDTCSFSGLTPTKA